VAATASVTGEKRSLQWRLSTLLFLMLGFAIVFGGVANFRSHVIMEVNFSSLPATDDALKSWLDKEYLATDLTVSRPREKAISIRFARSKSSFDIPNPPWNQLGYGALGSFTFHQSLGFSWWIPIGLVVIFCAGWLATVFSRFAAFLFPVRQIPAKLAETADR
jgi:hypothetical protein